MTIEEKIREQRLNPAALVPLYRACREFVRRVEAGEARSVASYTQMKAAIARAEDFDAGICE